MRAKSMTVAYFFLAITCLVSSAVQAGSPTPEILVTALRGAQWQVRYDFAQPVDRLEFKSSPDDSRGRTWLPDQGFEIVTTDRGEVARRKDGAHFRTVRFRMSPTYSVLPKEYAPFSPFGDGGMLFHTGRFFACQDGCPADAAWSMYLWAATEDQIILDGKALKAQAHWIDRNDGRAVYVGKNVPQQTDDFIAVLDAALPERIRGQLLAQLPEFMHLFTGKLGALPTRPMLYVSYDASHPKGWGRQGGVLPGQVFIHFYGGKWPAEMEKPDFPNELAWHLAHEAAHMYQRQTSTESGDEWITEGAAEAFAAMALRADASAYVQSAEEKALGKCRDVLKGRSVRDAIAAGTFDAAYSCGMLINLAIDSKVRLATKHDGLYAVWRNYLRRASNSGSVVSRAAYLEAVSDVGDADIAERVQKAVADQGANLIGAGAAAEQGRQVAITIDDLPRGGDGGPYDPAGMRVMTEQLLRPIGKQKIPVMGFVNAGRRQGGPKELREILDVWLDAGADLGNHSFSHPDINNIPLSEYVTDIERGEPAIREALAARGRKLEFYRHPFLHTGPTADIKQGLQAFLDQQGYRVAPVTLDNADYAFAMLYQKPEFRERVRSEYVPYMESVVAFFEQRSMEVVGREIPQILLIHANQLNADLIPELLDMFRRRGYTFVTLAQALKDPAYNLPETYVGRGGVSWIHRWSTSKGMAAKIEPDPAEWVQRAISATR